MTKKQIDAMKRIIRAEGATNINRGITRPCGEHLTEDHYCVTDGVTLVVYPESIPELPKAEPTPTFHDFLCLEERDGNHTLADDVPSPDQLRKFIRDFKSAHGHTLDCTNSVLSIFERKPLVQIRSDENGESGWYDARLLLNVMEAVGTGCRVFIGRRKDYRNTSVLVYQKDEFFGITGMVLPVRA